MCPLELEGAWVGRCLHAALGYDCTFLLGLACAELLVMGGGPVERSCKTVNSMEKQNVQVTQV